ncbi:hypothetical protein, variant [Capsaspora owczarzaki ATCC 30864]|nr:hypothetical protein, variant [Capsaspora owczarzaki ATCC 30864]
MYEYPTIFTPGYFAYPFQFTLPANLPGVFMKHKKSREDTRMKAEIFYKIKATLDIPGTKHDLKITQPLVIHERLDLAIAPQHYTKNGTVRLLCCIPRGDVNVEAWMDKNAYMAGETAQIHVRVQNGSKSNIDNFAVKLMRVITITNGHGASKVITDTVAQQQYPGCLAGESKESDIPLPLVSKKGARGAIKPATTAGLVKCVYHVDIEMQIPWAPDVEIHAPVKIYAPANFAWAQWQPPQWAAQATIQPVMGDLSVPQAVLQTQFTGLPAF